MSEPIDILANAIVTGPNVYALDESARANIPATPATDEGTPATAPLGEVGQREPGEPDEPEEAAEPGDEPVPDEPDEAEPPPEGEPAPRQSRKSRPIQPRIADLTSQRNAARDEAERAKQELEYWKQQALKAQPREAPEDRQLQQLFERTPQGRPLRPVEDSFPTTEAYQQAVYAYEDALVDWRVDQRLHAERLLAEEAANLDAVREAHADYDEVMARATMPVSPLVQQVLLSSPQLHALKYHLAHHPDDLAHLNMLSPPEVYRSIGRLEALVQAPEPPAKNGAPAAEPVSEPTPTVSQAPAPIRPTRGVGARAPRSYDDMSLTEFFSVRNKEETAARR